MKLQLPTDPHFAGAVEIAARLRGAGHQVYFAGGCVRDLVRGEAPKDYDVVTDARPEQVDALFRRTVLVGAAFGVVRVMLRDGLDYEVATFRKDADYSDGRHPDRVEYSSSKEEDVERRDFTINALLLDPQDGEILDFVGGLEDLEAGLIRAVGEPARRFREDRLRMLRAVRFAARFGFAIDPGTLAEITREAPEIGCVSVERVVAELDGIFLSKDPARGLDLLAETGLLRHVLPFLPVDASGRVSSDALDRLRPVLARLPGLAGEFSSEARTLAAWAAALSETQPPVSPSAVSSKQASAATRALEGHLRDLKMSRAHVRFVQQLVQARPLLLDPDASPLATRVRMAIDPDVRLFRAFLRALDGDAGAERRWRAIDADLEAHPLPALPLVTGEDLKDLGVPPGPAYKDVLRRVEDEVLERRIVTREDALAFARALVAAR